MVKAVGIRSEPTVDEAVVDDAKCCVDNIRRWRPCVLRAEVFLVNFLKSSPQRRGQPCRSDVQAVVAFSEAQRQLLSCHAKGAVEFSWNWLFQPP